MGNMGRYVSAMQTNLKDTSTSLALFLMKVVVGGFIGFTLSLIGQTLVGYGLFTQLIVVLVVVSVFYLLTRRLSFLGVGLCALFFLLLGAVIRMYALIAPNL